MLPIYGEGDSYWDGTPNSGADVLMDLIISELPT